MAFSVGDLVEHRASGQRGVVYTIEVECTKHDAFERNCNNALWFGEPDPECEFESTGYLTLETAFEKQIRVHERNVIKVHDDLPDEPPQLLNSGEHPAKPEAPF